MMTSTSLSSLLAVSLSIFITYNTCNVQYSDPFFPHTGPPRDPHTKGPQAPEPQQHREAIHHGEECSSEECSFEEFKQFLI